MKYLLIGILIASNFILANNLMAQHQNTENSLWSDVNSSQNEARPEETWMRTLSLDETKLENEHLKKKNIKTIELPFPDGSFKSFKYKEASLMAPELAAKFPNIKTYKGVSIDGKSSVRFDYSTRGFHAIIYGEKNTIYIDPDNHLDRKNYICYNRKDYIKNNQKVFIEDELVDIDKVQIKKKSIGVRNASSSGSELRKYRIAIAANGEYTTFHGGTVELGLAAVVTTLNRVTGIYENEVAVTFELVANNDTIIYINAETDPYTENNELDQNQTNLDAVIGTENYDIGHVFTTASGGVAGLGVVCSSSSKAIGTTGTNNPTGDPFDVDYVAHELGHQFGANHTFNGSSGSCGSNRAANTAFEPGSGTSIMAYAGICAPQNTQNNSDAYFHVGSLEEIVFFTTLGSGSDCASVSNTFNTPPVVTISTPSVTIPISTPFRLEGSATDVDNDNLLYSWEEYDLGPQGHPNEPVANAPLFRVFAPIDSGIRIFPQTGGAVKQTQNLGELLPSYGRAMIFQLIARDNNINGGGFGTANLNLEVTEEAGPFVVTSQNKENISYPEGSVQSITWSVAGTSGEKIDCKNVKISLSIDGGLTFIKVLAESTPNDGSENIVIPELATEQGRLKVEAIGNIFFNINSTNFSITKVTEPDFYLTVERVQQTFCSPDDGIYLVSAGGLKGFDGIVNLSLINTNSELDYSFSSTTIRPGEQSKLTISGTSKSTKKDNEFVLEGVSDTLKHSSNLGMMILTGLTSGPVVKTPADNHSGISLSPKISWDSLSGAGFYDFELATDNNFSNIIQSKKRLTNNEISLDQPLQSGINYFWRVRGTNDCSQSEYTSAEFQTLILNCTTKVVDNIRVIISDSKASEVSSSVEVTEDFIIDDLNILGLNISHTWVEDLTISLVSPNGKEVILMNQACGDSDDILINFDSDSSSILDCPATGNNTYQPTDSLSAFNGMSSKGVWKLVIKDAEDEDGGSLKGWNLELCNIYVDIVLSAEVKSHEQIDLSWTYDNTGSETGFELEVSTDEGTTFSKLIALNAGVSTYSHIGLNASTRYDYRVSPVLANGSINYSRAVNKVTILSPSDAPTDLKASISNREDIVLEWTDNSSIEEGFYVERKQNLESEWKQIGNTTEPKYIDNDIQAGTTSSYRVLAYSKAGKSNPSNEVTILITALRDEIVKQVNLYPNPSKEVLRINLGDASNQQIKEIKIVDISGKSILQRQFQNTRNVELSISELNKGVYFVNISLSDGVVVKKWIKM